MDKSITELRDLFANKEALEEKRKVLKAKLLAMRDAEALAKGKTELANIDTELREVDEKIKTKQERESKTMNNGMLELREVNKLETVEYRKAFMEYIQRGKKSDVLEFRADANTTTGTAATVIPQPVMDMIIKEMKVRGNILSKVRKLNVKGGLHIPLLSVTPTATWITEASPSERKKLDTTDISFSFYGLECKIAQTLLSEYVSIDAFEREFAILAVNAMVDAKEIAVFNGTGTGQPLGITVDPRIAAGQKVGLTAAKVILFDEWVKGLAKLPVSYRTGAELFMSAGTWAMIEAMKDTQGQPIARVNYGINNGTMYRFMGYNVTLVEEDRLPSFTSAAAGKTFAVLGNLSQYAINSNGQLRVIKYIDEDKNVNVTKALEFCDGKILDKNAFILFTKAAA